MSPEQACSAGMACKTLSLAAQQTFVHLEQLLGEPCYATCKLGGESSVLWSSAGAYLQI